MFSGHTIHTHLHLISEPFLILWYKTVKSKSRYTSARRQPPRRTSGEASQVSCFYNVKGNDLNRTCALCSVVCLVSVLRKRKAAKGQSYCICYISIAVIHMLACARDPRTYAFATRGAPLRPATTRAPRRSRDLFRDELSKSAPLGLLQQLPLLRGTPPPLPTSRHQKQAEH
mgnify:CR=1 FL=1